VSLVTRLIADALGEGRQIGREAVVTRATGPEIEPEPEPVAPAQAPATAALSPSDGAAPAADDAATPATGNDGETSTPTEGGG
jgi:hypothetical protein